MHKNLKQFKLIISSKYVKCKISIFTKNTSSQFNLKFARNQDDKDKEMQMAGCLLHILSNDNINNEKIRYAITKKIKLLWDKQPEACEEKFLNSVETVNYVVRGYIFSKTTNEIFTYGELL